MKIALKDDWQFRIKRTVSCRILAMCALLRRVRTACNKIVKKGPAFLKCGNHSKNCLRNELIHLLQKQKNKKFIGDCVISKNKTLLPPRGHTHSSLFFNSFYDFRPRLKCKWRFHVKKGWRVGFRKKGAAELRPIFLNTNRSMVYPDITREKVQYF